MSDSPYRDLPGIDRLLRTSPLAELDVPATLRTEAAREAVASARRAIADGHPARGGEALAREAADRAARLARPSLRALVNATGVIVHTNLGRAPLAPGSAAEGAGYANLEYDLAAGRRGSRQQHATELLRRLSGSESALVVNNAAAAVVLMLGAVAYDREVVISRGELVEIGGSFRIPDILEASGARLREVGTTNRTWIRDYERAIGPDTAAILRVHPSNFRVTGFARRPEAAELARRAHAHDLPFLHDLGSGTFAPLPEGLDEEPDPGAELRAGADLLCFSGDKLLGGPQAGIVLGSRDLVDLLAAHPLARAMRVDKLALAALEETLLAHRLGRPEQVPVHRMLHAEPASLRRRAEALGARLADLPVETAVIHCDDAVGGGSHPDTTLPGAALALRPRHGSAQDLADGLRTGDPPVVTVVGRDRDTDRARVELRLRTIDEAEEDDVVRRVREVVAAGRGEPGASEPG